MTKRASVDELDGETRAVFAEQARVLGRPLEEVLEDALRRGFDPAAAKDKPIFRARTFAGKFRPGVNQLNFNHWEEELPDVEPSKHNTA